MTKPSFEDVVEAVLFELNRINDSKVRLTLILAQYPEFFSNEQIKNLVQQPVQQPFQRNEIKESSLVGFKII